MPIRVSTKLLFATRATLFRLTASRGIATRKLGVVARPISAVGNHYKPIFKQSRFYAGGPPVANEQNLMPITKYHRLADDTLDNMLEALEEWSEEKPEVKDLEFSNNVLTLVVPTGTYVVNKQPPNRQIWLSSPISGPARFDYNIDSGEWVNLRNGTTLESIFQEELGVEWEPVNFE